MISRYNVYLNGVGLGQIDPDIYVSDISYETVDANYESQRRANGTGSYRGEPNIEKQTVIVSFAVEIYDTARRQRVMQAVQAWAQAGGWLTTSDRDWQRIYVVCDRLPAVTSALKWKDIVSVEFGAYEYPYWQETEPYTVETTTSGTGSKTVTLLNTGYIEAPLEALIVPQATVTSVNISTGGKTLSLTGLSAPSGSQIKMGFTDDRHILYITLDGTSILDKRTAASPDALMLQPGNNSVSVSASASVKATFYVRGVSL